MPRVFVIRGFGVKKDSAGQSIDFELVHRELIVPALEQCGLAGGTTGDVVDAGNIRADMFALILEADIVICDITVHNANVFYELGIRHAMRKKSTVLIKGDPSADVTPFDLSTDYYLKYPVAEPRRALDELVKTVQGSLHSARETDSPIFLMLPTLPEVDPAKVTLVPLDFIEEVKRAEKARDKGLLRVIVEDLRGQRFQREGLRHVARAQWSLWDPAGARESWETLRNLLPTDIEANLALSNLYEREYRVSEREALMEASNQAIRRVLDAERASPAQRAEALALEGRNMKTLWRARLAGAKDPEIALRQGLDARARQSYDSYKDAFKCDQNAFYPGLAALQMGHILLRLSELSGWRTLFQGNKTLADRAREDLKSELPALTHVVAASITRSRKQLSDDKRRWPEIADADLADMRLWADIADADLLFLSLPEGELAADPSVVVQAYRDAIPPNKEFARDATRDQLALFAQLGMRADVARQIMDALGPKKHTSKEHLVVFAGHCIDVAGAPPRLPAAAEGKARAHIAERLRALQHDLAKGGGHLTVLASAAPGANLLVHEVCDELRVPSRLCLPMPADDVARLAFPAADQWRKRFLAIVKGHKASLLQMAEDDELPRWLQGRAGIDPWERGNRWVMQLAQAWDAQRVTLLVLWDGEDDGRNGGTAQMVRMAKALGRFALEVIDSRQLLN